jgi:7-keto-8-aminopelargonate synthetase-like enzyme
MSIETHNTTHAPRHIDVSFEERDIKAGTIYKYLFALGVAVVGSLLICVYILRLTTEFSASSDTPPPPSREAHQKELPPEPRLQGFDFPGQKADPQADLRNKIREDSEANEKLEWIDRSKGIAQIPVKDAMKIVAEKGLSAAPAPAGEKGSTKQ